MLPETTYHIFNHAIGNENLFRNKENYLYFLKRYNHYINPIADTFAYCLMPNHFHLLIRTKLNLESSNVLNTINSSNNKQNSYSKAFADFFNSYSKSYNKMYHRRGSLFIHKFKRKEVKEEAYLTKLIHYIHQNPLHHGFVKNINEWPYSSYNELISNNHSNLLKDEVLNWFNGYDEFIKFHQQ